MIRQYFMLSILAIMLAFAETAPASHPKGENPFFPSLKELKESRSQCILNIRNIQQAIRANQNLLGLRIGDVIPWNDIFGKGKFILKKPKCPCGGNYVLSKTYPKAGTVVATCSYGVEGRHRPQLTKGW